LLKIAAMLIKTRGIIFRTVNYSETSIIADVYTEEKGLRNYIISGVRSKNARISAGFFQLMSLLDIVAYEREGSALTRIKEVRPAFVYNSLPFDVIKGAIGVFMLEIARKTIIEEEQNLNLFQFLFDTFVSLDEADQNVANVHLVFLLELSAHLGFRPVDTYSEQKPFFDLKEGIFCSRNPIHPYALNGWQSKFFSDLLKSNQGTAHLLQFSETERKELLDKLLDFYRLHMEGFPEIKSHKVLETILG